MSQKEGEKPVGKIIQAAKLITDLEKMIPC